MIIAPDLHPDDATTRRRIAAHLRYIREDSGMSQPDLADILGINKGNVSQLELRDNWHVRTVQAWARALGRRIDLAIDGLTVPHGDGDMLAALYASQQPETVEAEDQLDLRILGNNLTRIRRDRDVTLVAVAARLGCSPSAVYRHEADVDGILLSTLQRHVRALDGSLRVRVMRSRVGAVA